MRGSSAKILIVTSRRLEEAIKKNLEIPEGYEVEVWGLPVDVVALLTPESLKRLLLLESQKRDKQLNEFDYVIVSGMIPGDLSPLSEEFDTKVVKGTKTINDFYIMMKNFDKVKDLLSPSRPIDEVLEEFKLDEFVSVLNNLSYEPVLEVGSLKIPLNPPPSFLAAEVLDNEDLEAQLSRASEVADMVIIGSTSTSPNPSKVPGLLKLAEKYFDTIGFDSMFPSEHLAAKEADLILSLDKGKMEKLVPIKDKVFVLVPGDSKANYWPLNYEEKVRSIRDNLEEAKKLGFDKLILDPILSPFPYTLDSLMALREMKKLGRPTMVGLSNFVELVDADSHGVTFALLAMAFEAGANLVMVTEHSNKCKGNWYEAKIALSMLTVAKVKSTLPKDLGLNLLVLKEKRLRREKLEKENLRKAKDYKPKLEPSVVRIWVEGDKVYAKCKRGKEVVTYEGHPYLIGKSLVMEGWVKEPSHALYLGWELHKAYMASKLEKSYVQERELECDHPREKWKSVKERMERGRKLEGKGRP